MKILFILENHYPKIGGVETLFKNLTDSLAQQGHQITVLTNRSFKDNLKPKESYMDNLQIIRTPFGNRYLFTFFAWLPAIFLARKHDLIHTTSYNAGIPAIIAGFLTRKKVIITFHEVWGKMWFELPFFGKFSLFLHYLFEQVLLKLPFTKFIAVSNFTALQLQKEGIKKDKISMIYNGLNYDEFQLKAKIQKNNSIHNFLYFGRLGISKGLDILIEGSAQVSQDFTFTLILPRQPEKFLETIKGLIAKNNLESKTNILHELDFESLKKEVASADTIVIPSYSEGFCFTAAEAMALGVPIISSNKGALKEVVSGRHIHMEELSGEALASAMSKAIQGDYEFKELIKFPLADSIQSYITLYNELQKSIVT